MKKLTIFPSPQEIVLETVLLKTPDELAVAITNMANAGDPDAIELLDKVIGVGFDGIAQLVADLIRQIQITFQPSLDEKTGGFALEPVLSTESPVVANRKSAYALTLSFLNGTGKIDRIRKCQECGNYFAGDPRSKWCSKNCGSRNRQRIYQEGLRKKKKAKKRATG